MNISAAAAVADTCLKGLFKQSNISISRLVVFSPTCEKHVERFRPSEPKRDIYLAIPNEGTACDFVIGITPLQKDELNTA